MSFYQVVMTSQSLPSMPQNFMISESRLLYYIPQRRRLPSFPFLRIDVGGSRGAQGRGGVAGGEGEASRRRLKDHVGSWITDPGQTSRTVVNVSSYFIL